MKLIYIANARIPTEKAHGFQIMKMCEAFAINKINIELIAPRRFNKIKQNPFEYYDIQKNFKITRLPCLDLTTFNLFGKIGFFIQTIAFLIFVKIYLFFQRYDILYTREQLTGLFFKNFVLEIHFLPKKITSFHKKIWRKSRTLVVLTTFIKNKLTEIGISENKILVASDAVDLKKFNIDISKDEARQKLNLPLNKKIIIYAGHLYEWKGADILAKSSEYLDDDYLIIFVGGTDEDIATYNSQLTIHNRRNVKIVGRKPYSTIPYWLKSADILVLPNKKGEKISEEYTSPLKLFEYMASGRPIITSDLPSIREILNEDNAIFVEPNNPQALAEAIKIALQNTDFSDKIAKTALEDAKQYSWGLRAQRIINFIIL